MNMNQSKNLTQKQKELIKRLESIRNNREGTDAKPSKAEIARNSGKQQRRNEKNQQPTNSKRPSNQERTRTASEKKFTRPLTEIPAKVDQKVEDRLKYVPRDKNIQRSKKEKTNEIRNKKKKPHYVNQLSNGKGLSQALILSEILDKPLALRKR